MLHLEHSFLWCWRRMETDRVRNEEVLRRVNQELIILKTRRQIKAHWTGHSLSRICLLNLDVESNVELAGKWGIQLKQLTCYLNEMRKYCKLKEEAMDPISGTRPLEEAKDIL